MYTVIEPKEELIEKFKANVCNQPSLKNISFEFYQMDCDEFSQTHSAKRFHLIHVIHVLYYIEDYKAFFKTYTDMLLKDGVLLILNESKGKP